MFTNKIQLFQKHLSNRLAHFAAFPFSKDAVGPLKIIHHPQIILQHKHWLVTKSQM